jgi:hypothetical protein
MVESRRLDFIKLDIETEEKRILVDPPSVAVLCEAICIFMELHERMEVGCEAAFKSFLRGDCGGRHHFEEVAKTGEYIVICQVSNSVERDSQRLQTDVLA